ncbi:helix-turn-helix domain-containing protein [Nocardiopsis dassonvillei]|uniref:helix-turn-helix domain-containing protein n=1 Tax=Nocardiopsis dassonvillei TaxID=2014 RepID=UPI003556D526
MRMDAAEHFARGEKTGAIARELRVTERSVRRWRHAWEQGGTDALRSKGPSAERLSPGQWERLERELERGPLEFTVLTFELGDRLADTRRVREETTEHRGLRIRKHGSTEAGTCQSLHHTRHETSVGRRRGPEYGSACLRRFTSPCS